MKSIPINPKLPPDFFCNPIDERSQKEIISWWRVPFILSEEYSQVDATYQDHVNRVSETGLTPLCREEWEAMIRQTRESWFNEYPTGKRYNVRRLDGGAWDRPTNYGFFGSLDEAIDVAEGLLACRS